MAINRLAQAIALAMDVRQLIYQLADTEQLPLTSLLTLAQTLDGVDQANWRKSEVRKRLEERWRA